MVFRKLIFSLSKFHQGHWGNPEPKLTRRSSCLPGTDCFRLPAALGHWLGAAQDVYTYSTNPRWISKLISQARGQESCLQLESCASVPVNLPLIQSLRLPSLEIFPSPELFHISSLLLSLLQAYLNLHHPSLFSLSELKIHQLPEFAIHSRQ